MADETSQRAPGDLTGRVAVTRLGVFMLAGTLGKRAFSVTS